MFQYTIGFIGTGNMGSALVRAACKGIGPQQVVVTNHTPAKAQALAKEVGCQVVLTNEEVARQSKFIMLGVKPHILPEVLRQIAPVVKECMDQGEEKVLVSMAAGVTMESMYQHLGLSQRVPMLRIMPNTPAAIGKGMTLIHPECCKPELVDEFETIMAQSGRFDRIGENLADAAGAASGCVPAFAYLFMEGLADGAVMAGVPRQKAMTYVAQAVLGAASLVLESGQHPGALKDAVCSPGGSTIVGVSKLEEGGLRSACIQAVAGSAEKNKQLGK